MSTDTSGYSDPTSCRRVAYLASQRELGLCAKRRPRLGRLDLGHSGIDRSALAVCKHNKTAKKIHT